MQEYFDIHSHILPGIDDGPESLDETLRMLSIAYDEGIRIILATPHFFAWDIKVSSEGLINLYNEVNDVISNAGIDLNIILGSELFYCAEMIGALNRGEALTIDGTRYILVEFPLSISFQELWKGLNHCIFAGYIPILAHVERYRCLTKQPSFVGDLICLGAYMQMNLSSIHGRITNPKVSFCHKLLKKEWVHFLGTDAHGAYHRAPYTKEAVAYIKKKFGEKRVRQLLWENPMTMLENNHL
ncbi:MAG: CpsB/CapC family capsule biosynthesis tyrosine phosphatase [Mobilitalea sp.]